MSNLSIKINFLKLNNVAIRTIQGKQSAKRCLIIPIEDNNFFENETNCTFEGTGFEITGESKYGDSHYVKPNVAKAVYDAMSVDERKAIPTVGYVKPFEKKETVQEAPALNLTPGDEKDLPF